ncbi:hypothetical protein BKP35_09700 [Anaerobacillus arseniciselenatis]|uniref:histidine kinase n=1 Tax=Anaerobacillus arseniciselenatis TaxID=85682 RepID=A0A1S2LKD4_9BACI|nr:ATP-binding protein [Anaerobacillus arseniciselenatis]OIJ12836.1 hypothetical protein BKP35_09700 [Anaerobacillus arseniciselenatis]
MNKKYPINTLIKKLSTDDCGAHILYVFSDIDKYIENATKFIYEGITQGDIVLFNDSEELNKTIVEQLKSLGLTKDQLNNLKLIEMNKFYLGRRTFDAFKVSQALRNVVQPYMEQGYSVRTWGQVPFINENVTIEQLRLYECNCDDYIGERKMISVCTYDGFNTPALVQNELLKTHTHFMTDDDYLISPFYHKKHHQSLTTGELYRIQKLEQQKQYLEERNNDLLSENKSVKLKNEVIKQNEAKLCTIINELPLPIIIRNESTILFYNEVAKKQFQINSENIFELRNLIPFFEKFSLIEAAEKQIQEHQFSHINGEKKFYLVKSISLLFDRQEAFLHSFIDITQEKDNENLIIRSEKMNIAGELAASIAHELRNPLAAIKGFFHILKTSDEEKELYFNVIEDELSRIEQISSELLTLAKPHSEDRKVHNIIQLVNEVILLLTSQANMKSVEINLLTKKDEIFIKCEAAKIKQVFINMIKNAIDAMENPGNISLVVNEMSDNIQIEIIDEGSGIPEEVISKIGEPFYTTKEKGTGIGLMVCYQIIESHGGNIQVESKVGNGTKFTITFPTLTKKVTTSNEKKANVVPS